MKNDEFGVGQWASRSVNCVDGCTNFCKYCFSHYDAVKRYKRLLSEDWPKMRVREKDVKKRYRKKEGVTMFPSSHDIQPAVLIACMIVLGKLLAAGNRVLLVSKPHIVSIREICREFSNYKETLECRFTIGADDNKILKYWEPGAPCFEERLECLQLAHATGFVTSVSGEPLLDTSNVVRLFRKVEPHISTFWAGKMNMPRTRVAVETDRDRIELEKVIAGQTDDRLREIYAELKDEPKIRFKKPIRKAAGLEI